MTRKEKKTAILPRSGSCGPQKAHVGAFWDTRHDNTTTNMILLHTHRIDLLRIMAKSKFLSACVYSISFSLYNVHSDKRSADDCSISVTSVATVASASKHAEKNKIDQLFSHVNESVYPLVSELTKKYPAVPASTVPSERVFSTAKNMLQKKGWRLLPACYKNVSFCITTLK